MAAIKHTFAQTSPVEKIYLSASEAAKYLGVSADFMRDRRNDGTLSYYKFGNKAVWFKKTDLDRFVAKNRVT